MLQILGRITASSNTTLCIYQLFSYQHVSPTLENVCFLDKYRDAPQKEHSVHDTFLSLSHVSF